MLIPAGLCGLQRIRFLIPCTVTLTGVVRGLLASPWFLLPPAMAGADQLLMVAAGWCLASRPEGFSSAGAGSGRDGAVVVLTGLLWRCEARSRAADEQHRTDLSSVRLYHTV
jgi:hypothetical protein